MPKKDTYPKTAISVLYKNSTRGNAKLKMKVFRNKNIDDVLDPDIKLRGIPVTAEIVKVGVGEASVQDFKDILNPPAVKKVAYKAPTPAPVKLNYYQKKKLEKAALKKAEFLKTQEEPDEPEVTQEAPKKLSYYQRKKLERQQAKKK